MKIGILAIAATLVATTSAALAVEPDEVNGAQGVVVTSFSIGLSDPNNVVPTLDGVPGAGVHNWDIPTPKALLLNGTSYIYQMTFQSVSYSGSCKATYKLTQKQGTKNVVLDSGVLAPKFDCTSLSNWIYAVPGAHPLAGVAGAATLTGTLTLDGGKITVQTPVTIQ